MGAAEKGLGDAPYGLVGRRLGHSWSAQIHERLGSAPYQLVELEPDDGRIERDVRVFERSMLEGLLGTSLDGEKLSSGAWDDLRSQVMTERIYDTAWELAERD